MSKLKPTSEALIDELHEQSENLHAHCKAFGRGEYAVYKSMSVTLRLLLMGSSGDPPLISTVLPCCSLLPLSVYPTPQRRAGIVAPAEIVVVNDAGGELHYGAGSIMRHLGIKDGGIVLSQSDAVGGDVVWRTEVKTMFDLMGARLPVSLWLRQPFLRADWNIESFIRSVAHKDGGAHIGRNEQLQAMEEFGNIHRHLTERLSAYIALEFPGHLARQYPSHRRRAK